MSTVTIRRVTKAFGNSVVLRDFDAVFRDGEFVTLLGPSGCGKTTMLRIIAGFEKPTSGEVYIDDLQVSGGKAFVPPEKRGIGMVFQNYAVWPHMNVFENVAYPLRVRKQDRETVRSAVNRVLETVHLTPYAERLPAQLSGGQQQRVALARALVTVPRLLLLDEPLSNLDAKLRESMRFEIKEIQRQTGITVVYVTHDQTEAMAMSDRIFLLNGGAVQQSGTPAEIYCSPATPFAADFLGRVDFFKGEAADGRITFPGLGGQSVPYAGDRTGPVVAAVRPENLFFAEDGPLGGVLEKVYYLGDTIDCRVRAGSTEMRVIAGGWEHGRYAAGQAVRLQVRDMMVFPDDGQLEETLAIRT